MKKTVFMQLEAIDLDALTDARIKRLFVKGVKGCERTQGSEIHQANWGEIPEWQADSLSQLARKLELAEELLSLEKDYPLILKRLANYRNALKRAIQSRLED